MKSTLITIAIIIAVIGTSIGLSYAFGWIGVHQTKTIGKAQKDADRQVFEQAQSYVEGKRQEAGKRYHEYLLANEDDKKVIRTVVSQSFANFDEELLKGKVKAFVYNCKYN